MTPQDSQPDGAPPRWWSRLTAPLRREGIGAMLARGAAAAFTFQVAGTAVRYLSQVCFARWMNDTAEFGGYALGWSWAQLLALLAPLGTAVAVLRFIPQYRQHRQLGLLHGVVRRTAQITALVGLAVALIGGVVIALVAASPQQATALTLGMALVPVLALLELTRSILRGFKRIGQAFAPPLVGQPTLALAAAAGVFFATGALAAWQALAALLGAALAMLACQCWWVRRALADAAPQAQPDEQSHTPPQPPPVQYDTRQWLAVSAPATLISGFNVVLRHSDILMVGAFLGAAPAGVYMVATRTALLTRFVLQSLGTIAAPLMAEAHADNDHARLQRTTVLATRLMFWPSVAISAALIAFGGPILGLFGAGYRAGYGALVLIVGGQLVSASAGPVGMLLTMTGHERKLARAFGVTAVLNIGLNAALIPWLGMEGAAVATMATLIVRNVWMTVLVDRGLAIRLPMLNVFRLGRRKPER